MKRFFLLILIVFSLIINGASYSVSTKEEFENALKSATVGDEILLTSDISIIDGYSDTDTNSANKYTSHVFNGVTVKGNNHTLRVSGRNFELTGNTTFENINMILFVPDSTTDNKEATDISKNMIFYANGHDLTFDNVSLNAVNSNTGVTSSNENSLNTDGKPVIIMGSKKNSNVDTSRENTLTVRNTKDKFNVKTIIAGSDNSKKIGKTNIILDSKVDIYSNNGKILLKNLNNNDKIDVSIVNESQKVRNFDISDNSAVDIVLKNVKYGENADKLVSFNGKVNNLTLEGETEVILYSPLQADKIIMNKTGDTNPKLKVSKNDLDDDDDYAISNSVNGEITVNTIESNDDNNNIELTGTGSIEANTVTGKIRVTGLNGNNFQGYNDTNNPDHQSSNEEDENQKQLLKNDLKAKIDGKNNFSDHQKSEYKNRVESASSIEKLKELEVKINELEEAIIQFKKNKIRLENLKNNNINYFNELDEILKNEINGNLSTNIDDRLEISDINGINSNSNSLINNLENEIEKLKRKENEINQAILDAKEYIINNYTSLSNEEITEYEKLLNSQDSLDGINNIKNQAKIKNEENLRKANNLSKIKSNLKKYINTLNLSEEQKNTLNSRVETAQTENEVEEIRNEIDRLNNSKNVAINYIKENLKYLSSEEIEEFIQKINSKNIEEDIEIVKNEAITKNENNKSKFNEYKERVKTEIENLSNLKDYQKLYLKNKVDVAEDVKTIDKIKNTLEDFDRLMLEINKLVSEIEELKSTIGYSKFSNDDKNKVTLLENKLNDREELNTIEKIRENLIEAKSILNKLKELAEFLKDKKKVNLKDYEKYSNMFSYSNKDIVNSFDKDVYINLGAGKNISKLKNSIGLINLGFNKKVLKDVKVGGFIGYEKDNAHQIYVGVNAKYKEDLQGFIRYRLANYKKIFNHNIDTYVKYNKENKINDKLNIISSLGIYLSYSSDVNIDEQVKLNKRLLAFVDLETKLDYKINEYNIYLIPSIKLGYDKSVLEDKVFNDNKLLVNNNYIIYSLTTGLNKKFNNNILVDLNLNINGNNNSNLKFKTNLGLGYTY